ncbi:N-acetylmuramoyl-L-alanine amidase [Amphibacillus indicireducens]|uniref:SH3b domain-containing protein n=1 Tax=Amphibacillus indicireducens TaxID=1076330 RepID=A0ABP7VCH6_9BACI
MKKTTRIITYTMLLLLASLLFQSTSYANTVQIETDDLLVRSGPGTEYELIGHVNQGEDYALVEQTDDWLAIDFNGETGWVSRQYATITDQISDEPETSSSQTDSNDQADLASQDFKIPVDRLHLRAQATTQSEILAVLTEGETVTIVEQDQDWIKVLAQDGEGFIPAWLLNFQEPVIEGQTNLKNKVIVIDPGHGGADVGAISITDRYEKDYALNTAKHLEYQLEMLGATVYLTRSDDYYYALTPRAVLANYHAADVFLSIHYNSEPQYPSANGLNTYYRKDADQGLADAVHQGLVEKTNANDRGVLSGDYRVLRVSKQPSLLLELGFLSNQAEEKLIQTPAYQDEISRGIILGLENYFKYH